MASSALAASTREPAIGRDSDTRGAGRTTVSAKSGGQSARSEPAHSLHFPRLLGRKLTIRGGPAIDGFPNVKLLSRDVIAVKVLADAGSKAVTLVITVVAARRLNADPFGILAFAMATGWLLAVATDAGLSMHLAREVARDRTRSYRLLLDVVALRAGLAFFAATVIALLTPALVPAHWRLQFIVIALAQLAGGVLETVAHYFRGVQRSELESLIVIVQRGVTLIWALVVLWFWRRLDYLAIALLVPALVAAVVAMVVATQMSARDVDRSAAQHRLTPAAFVRNALPLGAGVLLSALYFRCDLYFIEHWHGVQPVGGYHAVFRLVEALRLLPAAVLAVLFPVLVQSTDAMLVKRVGAALTGVGVALALLGGVGASWLVPAIYGDAFAYASPAFAILCLALPLFFLNYALTHQVIGWDGQYAYLVIAAAALVANIAANLALVPSQGLVGAAISTVLTEVVVTAGCLYALSVRSGVLSRPAVSPRVEPL